MNQIAPGEYELLLDCIRELHSFRDVSALRSWLLDTALPKLVSKRHRAVLEALRPHLVIAFHQFELAGDRQMLLESAVLALNEFASATIVVNSQGRILCHAGPGLDWIGVAGSDYLPAKVADWIKQSPLTAPRRNLCLTSAAGEVRIRAVPTTSRERILLVLTLASPVRKEKGAAALALTPREAEVCHWICEGKANAEIAVILGASPRTVHKHVEHIFAKTGVASRVALTALLKGEG